ncbi:hypothetical protein BT93_E2291 [Corymbia citriodora subsp. variegata]|nr:hypothetical protein BT93_E2291 [Corymbia citriodora subsp. variegata]
MQLSGVRSTTKLIAHRVSLSPRLAMSKVRESSSPSFCFSPPCRHTRGAWGPMLNQNTQQALALHENEVIQLHLPVRLPCYNFTLVTSLASGIPLITVKPPTNALRPIIPDNACILYITATAGIELANAYSPDTIIASSLGKEVHMRYSLVRHWKHHFPFDLHVLSMPPAFILS